MRVAFTEVPPPAREALTTRIQEAIDKDARLREILAKRRDMAQSALNEAVRSGRISAEDLFDTHYRPVPGSNPEQFTTAALPFLESVLPAIQEPVTAEDSSIAFCVAVDRNGYLPVHMASYSRPQGDDPEWNQRHSRNRRKFDDRAGLAAARNLQEILVQTYHRQLDNGATVMMKDLSMPITVEGRHWGAMRMAVPVT